ncbi:MAG TPA: signal peptidase I, partial [Candidatus Polarisedimenticolia bacterium]|nr:signal peptidase I [Candidatus Polarisedimenticolia bacterium]
MINWLTSKTVREASTMCKHVKKLLQHQRDILSAKAVSEVETALKELEDATRGKIDNATLGNRMEKLEETANQWIKPYPHAGYRENIEVLLVALAVAMGIRTFFLQPFKIPTASMQPTLFGITSKNLRVDTDYQKPTGWGRVKDWLGGGTYLTYKADEDGTFDGVSKPLRFLIFNIKQTLWFNNKPHNFWFVPDTGGGMPLQYGLPQTIAAMFMNLPATKPDEPPYDSEESDLEHRMGVRRGAQFHKGDTVMSVKIVSGDHLFIDRVSYNFRPPGRGDIVVFQTSGIPEGKRNLFHIPPDEFYIKRLVGLGGETLSIKQDYVVTGVPTGEGPADIPVGHLVIDGHPLSASTPKFNHLYSFSNPKPGTQTIPYQLDHYFGHAMIGYLESGNEYHVAPDDFFVMGDNTLNSLDSRYWGGFPQQKVLGKAFFVYWPINTR